MVFHEYLIIYRAMAARATMAMAPTPLRPAAPLTSTVEALGVETGAAEVVSGVEVVETTGRTVVLSSSALEVVSAAAEVVAAASLVVSGAAEVSSAAVVASAAVVSALEDSAPDSEPPLPGFLQRPSVAGRTLSGRRVSKHSRCKCISEAY